MRSCGVLKLTIILLVIDQAAGNNCCPNDTVFIKQTRSCGHADEEGSFVQGNINCSMGMYLLDPVKDHQEKFFELEDGYLQIGENDSSYTVPPHMYCVTRIQVEEKESKKLRNVAFVCFPGEETVIEERGSSSRIYFGILLFISTVFLSFTLMVYLLLPELRDLQGRCIMSTVLSQMLAYLALVGLQFKGHILEDTPCLITAFFLYFWMLASFFWLNVASFNVWRTVTYPRFPLSDGQLFWCFLFYGWGCPLAFLAATLTTHHTTDADDTIIRPNFAMSKCWFHGDHETWVYFYGPISVLLVCNILFFLMTALHLWRFSGCENTLPGIRSLRFKCMLYLKIFMIMGILWIFEVLSFLVKGNKGFWYITDTLNSLQGVLIFLIVVCRKRVVHALAKREWGRPSIMCLCPRRCISGPDVEQEEAMLACQGDDETYVAMDAPTREHT